MELCQIVSEWLRENGYDGLCNGDLECGCLRTDLAPCGFPGITCEAGYARPPREDEPEFGDSRCIVVDEKPSADERITVDDVIEESADV